MIRFDNDNDIVLPKKRVENPSNEKIEINYEYDYDINIIHRKILSKFESKKKRFGDDGSYDSYMRDALPLIQEYNLLKCHIRKVDINKEENETTTEEDERKLLYVEEYLAHASKYIDMSYSRRKEKKHQLCSACYSELKESFHDSSTIQCSNCGAIFQTYCTKRTEKEGTYEKSGGNNPDDTLDNFKRSLNRTLGLQVDVPDNSLYELLDEYFISKGRPSGDEIKEEPENPDGTRGDTDHQMLWEALKKIRKTNRYEDSWLIGHNYWGWRLPDFAHLYDKIVSHYVKTQAIFFQMTPEERGRISSIGTEWRKFKHLQLVGYPCEESQFKVPENTESMRNQQRIWKIMCERANDPEIYYIP